MKRYLVLIGVGIAFVAVSLWVWLSRGKCASAVRTKFRLGGIILTLTSTMALGGCRLMMTCYDMPEPERTDDEVSARFNDYYNKYTDVVAGSLLDFVVHHVDDEEIIFVVETDEDKERTVLQVVRIPFPTDDVYASFVLDVGDYRGYARLYVYSVYDGPDAETNGGLWGSGYMMINIVDERVD